MVTNKVVPPGGEGSIKVTFSTRGYSGKRSKSVTVKTNDPDENNIRLTVSANVIVDFEFKPNRVYFGRLNAPERTEKVLEVHAKDPENLKIESIESSSEHIKAELITDESGEKKKFSLKVILLDSVPVGRINENITVKTNVESQKVVKIPIYGEVMGDIVAEPERINFGDYSKETMYERTFTLKSKKGKPFKVLEAESSDPRVKVDYEKIEGQSGYEFTAGLDEDFSEKFLRGSIKITTDQEDQKLINVSFHGYFRSNAQHTKPEKAEPNKDEKEKWHRSTSNRKIDKKAISTGNKDPDLK